MNISDWITLAAVIVALGIGVGGIIQTNVLRKKDRKERLLNEIVEWSEEVIIGGEDIDYTKLGEIKDQQQEFAYINNVFSKTSTKYEIVKVKSIYINSIAALFGDEILGNIKELTKYIIDYIEEMDYILGISEKEKDSRGKLRYNSPEASQEIKRRMLNSRDILVRQPEKMDLIAKRIIESATNIKNNV